MKSGHFIEFRITWASPVLIMVAASIFLVIIQMLFAEQLQAWGFTMADKTISVDEDLPNFFKSVMLSHADELVTEN